MQPNRRMVAARSSGFRILRHDISMYPGHHILNPTILYSLRSARCVKSRPSLPSNSPRDKAGIPLTMTVAKAWQNMSLFRGCCLGTHCTRACLPRRVVAVTGSPMALESKAQFLTASRTMNGESLIRLAKVHSIVVNHGNAHYYAEVSIAAFSSDLAPKRRII